MNEHLCEPKTKSHSRGKDFGSLMAKKTSLYREWDFFFDVCHFHPKIKVGLKDD